VTGRIVVGIDGSAASLDALRWAAGEARLRGADLDVAVVWELPTLSPAAPVPSVSTSALAAAAEDLMEETLGGEGLDENSAPPTHGIVTEGPVALTLLELGRHADLLVVGARGRGSFVGMLLGSVSQHVVSHAVCPVVVVPERNDEPESDPEDLDGGSA